MPSEQLEADDFGKNPVPACRRAIERLLKLITVFLHDGGLSDLLNEIWSTGKYGFACRRDVPDLVTEILKLELGPLNYFLYAASSGVHDRCIDVCISGQYFELVSACKQAVEIFIFCLRFPGHVIGFRA